MLFPRLGIYGCLPAEPCDSAAQAGKEADENLLLASLLTGDPVLLVGSHGTAKTGLFTKIAGVPASRPRRRARADGRRTTPPFGRASISTLHQYRTTALRARGLLGRLTARVRAPTISPGACGPSLPEAGLRRNTSEAHAEVDQTDEAGPPVCVKENTEVERGKARRLHPSSRCESREHCETAAIVRRRRKRTGARPGETP
jgi:hypothetical protein